MLLSSPSSLTNLFASLTVDLPLARVVMHVLFIWPVSCSLQVCLWAQPVKLTAVEFVAHLVHEMRLWYDGSRVCSFLGLIRFREKLSPEVGPCMREIIGQRWEALKDSFLLYINQCYYRLTASNSLEPWTWAHPLCPEVDTRLVLLFPYASFPAGCRGTRGQANLSENTYINRLSTWYH